MTKLSLWIILLICVLWSLSAIYGIVQLCTYSERYQQLDDYRFEINHLQTKLYRLQELSDYIEAMEQILPSLVLAQLKTATLMIQQGKYRAYEGVEQPLLNEKEKR